MMIMVTMMMTMTMMTTMVTTMVTTHLLPVGRERCLIVSFIVESVEVETE